MGTLTGLIVVLALSAEPLPASVQQECEDHVAALRTVHGVEVVYDCEQGHWLEWSAWVAEGEPEGAGVVHGEQLTHGQ